MRSQRVAQSTFATCVQASFHQASTILPAESRGSQCVCTALTALTFAQMKQPSCWAKPDLDSIIFNGDHLYRKIRGQKDFLLVNELPSTVTQFDKHFNVKVFWPMQAYLASQQSKT
jgi:hypothetical protein